MFPQFSPATPPIHPSYPHVALPRYPLSRILPSGLCGTVTTQALDEEWLPGERLLHDIEQIRQALQPHGHFLPAFDQQYSDLVACYKNLEHKEINLHDDGPVLRGILALSSPKICAEITFAGEHGGPLRYAGLQWRLPDNDAVVTVGTPGSASRQPLTLALPPDQANHYLPFPEHQMPVRQEEVVPSLPNNHYSSTTDCLSFRTNDTRNTGPQKYQAPFLGDIATETGTNSYPTSAATTHHLNFSHIRGHTLVDQWPISKHLSDDFDEYCARLQSSPEILNAFKEQYHHLLASYSALSVQEINLDQRGRGVIAFTSDMPRHFTVGARNIPAKMHAEVTLTIEGGHSSCVGLKWQLDRLPTVIGVGTPGSKQNLPLTQVADQAGRNMPFPAYQVPVQGHEIFTPIPTNPNSSTAQLIQSHGKRPLSNATFEPNTGLLREPRSGTAPDSLSSDPPRQCFNNGEGTSATAATSRIQGNSSEKDANANSHKKPKISENEVGDHFRPEDNQRLLEDFRTFLGRKGSSSTRRRLVTSATALVSKLDKEKISLPKWISNHRINMDNSESKNAIRVQLETWGIDPNKVDIFIHRNTSFDIYQDFGPEQKYNRKALAALMFHKYGSPPDHWAASPSYRSLSSTVKRMMKWLERPLQHAGLQHETCAVTWAICSNFEWEKRMNSYINEAYPNTKTTTTEPYKSRLRIFYRWAVSLSSNERKQYQPLVPQESFALS